MTRDALQTILQQREGVEELNGLDNVKRLYAFTSVGDPNDPDFYVVVGILPDHILIFHLRLMSVASARPRH